jgi:hypothetical protein
MGGMMSRKFIFKFKEISFDTDEGDGPDESTAYLLNSKYSNKHYITEAENENDALRFVIQQVVDMTGFPVFDVDYDVQIS